MKDYATQKIQDCEFPFRYKGELFYGCIDFLSLRKGEKVPLKEGDKPWCSTKVNETDREHVNGGGYWGECDMSICPNATEGLRQHQLSKNVLIFHVMRVWNNFRLWSPTFWKIALHHPWLSSYD